jgi:hypothetical protein
MSFALRSDIVRLRYRWLRGMECGLASAMQWPHDIGKALGQADLRSCCIVSAAA